MIGRALLFGTTLLTAMLIPVPAAAFTRGVQDDRVILGDVAARPQAFTAGRLAGATVWRIIVPWNRVETAPGRYDTGWLVQAVDQARAAGYRVHLTIAGTPTAPPAWHLAPRFRASWGFQSSFQIGAYVRLVRAVAAALPGKVALYSFVNEPDWYGFPACYQAHIFNRAARALRAIDPAARPVWGEAIGPSVISYTRHARRCGLRSHRIAWHYGSASTIRRVRAAFPHARLIISEWGSPVKAGEAAGGKAWASLLRQARRSHVSMITAYHVTDPAQPKPWDTSLLRPDGSPRPAYRAFARR